jgi:RNA-directed DNA polymerase
MHGQVRIVPHPRTLRKVREQVKQMVIDEVSPRRIRNYLHRWVMWWAMTSNTWQYQQLLQWFIDVCWHKLVAAYATALQQLHVKELHTRTVESVGAAA